MHHQGLIQRNEMRVVAKEARKTHHEIYGWLIIH